MPVRLLTSGFGVGFFFGLGVRKRWSPFFSFSSTLVIVLETHTLRFLNTSLWETTRLQSPRYPSPFFLTAATGIALPFTIF